MSPEEIKEWEDQIDAMSQIEMARLLRFAKVGHPVFNSTLPLYKRFTERFKELGGMTPQISKQIGWE